MLLYLLLGGLWIALSDWALDGGAASSSVQTVKGLAFVLVTGCALYALLWIGERRERTLLARLRETADATRDGFWHWDLTRDAFSVTEGGDKDLGWDAAQSIHDRASWRAVVHPDDWPAVEAALAPALAGESDHFAVDHRVRALDGGWIWYRLKGRVAEGEPGRAPRELAGTYYNVDQLKRTEAALRRANRALEAVARVNRARSSVRDADGLFAAVCEKLADTMDSPFVWIGAVVEAPVKRLWPIASGGPARRRFLGLSAGRGWGLDGDAPAGRALRDGALQMVQDLRAQPARSDWAKALAAAGVRASITIPFDPVRETGMRYVLQITAPEAEAFTSAEADTYRALAADLGRALEAFETASDYERRLKRALHGAVEALAVTVEKRDPYTAGHQSRVAELAAAIAREMRLSEDRIEAIRLGGSMHDIGKIGVPSEILSKPGRLDEHEMALVKRHPRVGYDIVKPIDFGWPIADIVHQHHERIDGGGYPQGLKGDRIALEARIVAVADVVESMATHRPYRAARPMQDVEQELIDGRGAKYDKAVVDAARAILARTAIEPGVGVPISAASNGD
ncbi:MAG: HD domain-containing protein [Alphaproteobacteria bacterium]|nr:HD domain-containing protein [Alphaproteobacteria bacterium]